MCVCMQIRSVFVFHTQQILAPLILQHVDIYSFRVSVIQYGIPASALTL